MWNIYSQKFPIRLPWSVFPIKFWCQWGNPWRPAPGHNFFLGSSKYRDGPKGGGYDGRICATQKLICILETTSIMMWKFRRLISQFWTDLSGLSSTDLGRKFSYYPANLIYVKLIFAHFRKPKTAVLEFWRLWIMIFG